MRVVVQRVNYARVSVGQEVVGEIKTGLLVLLGIKKGDTERNAEELTDKLSKLRIMQDEKGKMNLSVGDTSSSILVVSQFTLYADTKKGNRPSFIEVEDPKVAEKLYEKFITLLESKNIHVESGKFGEYMNIDLDLDGPVTITLEN